MGHRPLAFGVHGKNREFPESWDDDADNDGLQLFVQSLPVEKCVSLEARNSYYELK